MLNGTLASTMECNSSALNSLKDSIDNLVQETKKLKVPDIHETLQSVQKAVTAAPNINVGKLNASIELFSESIATFSKLNDIRE